ncbi:TPA: hypothetical protein ACGPS9_002241, partial [Streptococcus agalactiae]
MLDKPSRNSPRDKLKNHLKACQTPLKNYPLKAVFLAVIFIAIVFSFFSQILISLKAMGFTTLSLLILLVLGYPCHLQSLYHDLKLSIYQYQQDKIDFFKTYGE